MTNTTGRAPGDHAADPGDTADPTPPPPRWAVRAAHAAALVTLPSGLWRLLLAAGYTAGYTEAGYRELDPQGWGALYVVGLSLAIELTGLATLALVRPWGEVLPARLPLVGGRRPDPRTVTRVAWLATVVLVVTCLPFAAWWALPHPQMTSLGSLLVGLLYLPLAAVGPLAGAVTYAYQRRHRRA
ncbi:hypothetical protein ACWEQL_03870 [Kitasatospora sp. NPDC004240]